MTLPIPLDFQLLIYLVGLFCGALAIAPVAFAWGVWAGSVVERRRSRRKGS